MQQVCQTAAYKLPKNLRLEGTGGKVSLPEINVSAFAKQPRIDGHVSFRRRTQHTVTCDE